MCYLRNTVLELLGSSQYEAMTIEELVEYLQIEGSDKFKGFVKLMVKLEDEGIVVRDAGKNTNFRMRAALLMTVNDYPARSSLSGWSGQGYYACFECNDATPSHRITNKIYYIGHRQWLPTDHKMRNSRQFDGKKEKCIIPPRKTNKEIL